MCVFSAHLIACPNVPIGVVANFGLAAMDFAIEENPIGEHE